MKSNKLFLGVSLILIGLFYLFKDKLGELDNMKYIMNYQVVLFLFGLFLALVRKRTLGWFISIFSIYLFMEKFFANVLDKTVPILLLLSGVVLIILWVTNKNKYFDSKESKKSINIDQNDEENK